MQAEKEKELKLQEEDARALKRAKAAEMLKRETPEERAERRARATKLYGERLQKQYDDFVASHRYKGVTEEQAVDKTLIEARHIRRGLGCLVGWFHCCEHGARKAKTLQLLMQ